MSSNERIVKIRQSLKESILLFGKMVMPRTFYLESPEFHKEICEHLQNPQYKKLNIIAPRGTAKSSLIAGVYALHHLMFAEGQKVIVLSSRTQYHAVLLLQSIKDILDYSMEFRSVFGYWGEQSAKRWTSTEIILKDGSAIICKGTGQAIRGIKVGNQRPTLLILDDPEDENNTKTAESMEANLRWLLQQASPAIDPHKGRIIVIGTPLHERCMVLTLKEASGWITLHYKYIVTQDDGTRISLWPQMRDLESLDALKKEHEDIGRLSAFYREYMCEVIGDEDALFREEYFQYYQGEFESKDGQGTLRLDKDGSVEDIPVDVYMGVDPASSTRATADFSTIVVVGIDKRGHRYVLDYWHRRVTPLAHAEAIIEWYKRYRPLKTRIESNGYQEMLKDYLRMRCREEGIFIPGLEIKEVARTNKNSRLESMQPLFAKKMVWMRTSQIALRDELLLYPRSKHDDLMDGLFYAMKNITPVNESERLRVRQIIEMGEEYAPEGDWATA